MVLQKMRIDYNASANAWKKSHRSDVNTSRRKTYRKDGRADRLRSLSYYRRNRDKCLAGFREYHIRNRVRRSAYKKGYYQERREEIKKQHQTAECIDNTVLISISETGNIVTDKARDRESSRRYREKNVEKVKAANRERLQRPDGPLFGSHLTSIYADMNYTVEEARRLKAKAYREANKDAIKARRDAKRAAQSKEERTAAGKKYCEKSEDDIVEEVTHLKPENPKVKQHFDWMKRQIGARTHEEAPSADELEETVDRDGVDPDVDDPQAGDNPGDDSSVSAPIKIDDKKKTKYFV
ncbi:uncharacterized protein PV06_09773 [Exophiala oligosperma]|uniref:Uncharacterized protein n=1 Tax=Exophiala oligosperma TaxID=215243 RepID=A0A0D2DPL3_9EURO|nr:uncharacterized protein PV06_09773 [Exophiala oligosperma]KIW37784.1 hypothetical protein PV06_09773 [Exophiala oligosperma]